MSEENIPNFDAATAEFFSRLFKDSIQGIAAQLVERMNKLEEQVEAFDKQIATLVLGYGEQAVFMEALVAQLAFATDAARKQFQEDISRARKDMLEVMQNASKGLLADEDPGLASALADMAESKLADSD